MPKPFVSGERCHHLDAARMSLMMLGIPYHTALLFQGDIAWSASVGNPSPIAAYIVATIHIFRMPAFFLLSGYLAAVILSRTDGWTWLKGRLVALGIPLIFALVTIHPVQIVVPALLQGTSLGELARGQSVGHLWFLFALLGIAVIAVTFRKIIARTNQIAPSVLAAGAYATVAVSIGIATFARDLMSSLNFPLRNTATIMVWGIGYGLPFFLLGMLMVHRHDLARILTLYSRTAYITLLILVVAYVAVMPLEVDTMVSTVAGGLLAIPLTTAIILLCSRRVHHATPWIDTLTRSSFTVYLMHHPIVIILGAMTAGIALPWFVHFILICAAAWLLSLGIWFAVRDVPILNVLTGATPIRLRRKERPTPVERSEAVHANGAMAGHCVIS